MMKCEEGGKRRRAEHARHISSSNCAGDCHPVGLLCSCHRGARSRPLAHMPTDFTSHTHEVGAYAVGFETAVAFASPNVGQNMFGPLMPASFGPLGRPCRRLPPQRLHQETLRSA